MNQAMHTGTCETCGSWGSALIQAMCPPCREKYLQPRATATHSALRKPLAYLASPYTHADTCVRQERAEHAAQAAAALKRLGLHIFAPIPHGHALADYGLPTEYQYWQEYCHNMLSRSDNLIVLQLDGWQESIGVTDEIRHMHHLGKPVSYMRLAHILNIEDLQREQGSTI